MTPPQIGSWSRQPVVAAGATDRHGLAVIDDETCLDLLRRERIGRIGLSVGSLPVILPINYFVVDRSIVFRSEDGDKVRAAQAGCVACLEVDRFDRFEHTGWSVLATGRLSIVPPDRITACEGLPIVPWALGGNSRFIELRIEFTTGRRLS